MSIAVGTDIDILDLTLGRDYLDFETLQESTDDHGNLVTVYKVQSTSDISKDYYVTLGFRDGEVAIVACTCPAGTYFKQRQEDGLTATICKHIRSVVKGL